jgi:hypothetical protein
MARRNPFIVAEQKGFDAYMLGDNVCPYRDKRNYMNRLTWSRAYQIHWCAGWMKAAAWCEDWVNASNTTAAITFK